MSYRLYLQISYFSNGTRAFYRHIRSKIALALISRWKTMSDNEKKRFNQMAEQDKKRFDVEMANYNPGDAPKRGRGKNKKMKDPNAPKRCMYESCL